MLNTLPRLLLHFYILTFIWFKSFQLGCSNASYHLIQDNPQDYTNVLLFHFAATLKSVFLLCSSMLLCINISELSSVLNKVYRCLMFLSKNMLPGFRMVNALKLSETIRMKRGFSLHHIRALLDVFQTGHRT